MTDVPENQPELRRQGTRYDASAFEHHLTVIYDPLERAFLQSLRTGFFDGQADPSASYAPKLIKNDKELHENMLSALEREMKTCRRFDLSVAFVAASGIQVLLQSLLDLEARKIPVRLLTSTYLGFNDPNALERIRAFSNIELRVFEGPLHTKGYIFDHGDISTVIVGSSNLTQSALLVNSEWNLLVNSFESGSIWDATCSAFERAWNSDRTKPATDEWMVAYRTAHKRAFSRPRFITTDVLEAAEPLEGSAPSRELMRDPRRDIKPNSMQSEAMRNLAELRKQGAKRALLISATGTGKTYLAALDVKQSHSKRILFVVHRQRIAKDALASFRTICGDGHSYGLYSGSLHEKESDFVFSTIALLARHLDEFSPTDFDYLIIDEAHRAGAKSYQDVIAHFRPQFMLGMTATPDRTDGYDIYRLFDNNIAYRITLQKAQESDMLAPFHYFGITDLSVDGQVIDDFASFGQLVSSQRVDHIIAQIRRYTVNPLRRGLIFCSRVEEARELSKAFNERGFRTIALDGSSSDDVRDDAIERLECNRSQRDDWIEYIFTVDIFNEGVDIPSLNQVVMLRPTESAIIFVQQLGRGLRLHASKEFVLVLDFIGNYQKSFLIPVALSGDRSFNKDNLRRFMREGNRLIPGCSTISFDEVSARRVYQMLDAAKFGDVKRIKQEYLSLKNMLGGIPTLMDFCNNGSIDPELIFAASSLGSYHAFLTKHEKAYTVHFSPVQEQMLLYVSRKLATGKRPQELLLLRSLLATSHIGLDSYAAAVNDFSGSLPVAACSVANTLGGRFMTGSQAKTFSSCDFVSFDESGFTVSDRFAEALRNEEFRRQLMEVIDFGLMRNRQRFADNYGDTSFVLYQKYNYEEVCRLLEWEQNINGQNIGGYKYDEKTNTFPVFINYEKGEDISASIRYHDRFLSPSHLIAISKQPRHLNSPEIVRLRQSDINGMTTFLFVRKNKDDAESKEFYFLGTMKPSGRFEEIVMEGTDGKHAVEIDYVLDTPIPDELYDYLTSGSE